MNYNKLYIPAKNQRIVLTFWDSNKEVIKLTTPAEYASINSFRCSIAAAVRRLKLPIILRKVGDSIYLIKEQRT